MKKLSLLSASTREDILRGPIVRGLLKLGIPVAIGQLGHTLYELADIYWLGKIGRQAVAAPSASWPFIWALIATGAGFMSAGLALISQYRGANDREGVRKSLGQIYLLATAVSTIIAVAGYISIPHILRVAGIPRDVYPYAVVYARIELLGIVVAIYWEAFRGASSAIGDTYTPMKMNLLGALANAALDPIFIFGIGPVPRMEVAGAATATVLTRAAMGLATLRIILRGHDYLKLERRCLRPDRQILAKLLRVGAPLSAQYTGEALGFALLTSIISMEGSIALAAWGIGDRPFNMIHFFLTGLLTGAAVMVGQSLGAEDFKRAWNVAKTTLRLVGLVSLAYGLSLAVFRYQVTGFFINDPEVIEAASGFMLYMGITIFTFTFLQTGQSIAQGSGHTKAMMIVSLVRLWVLRNALAYLLGPGPLSLGVNGIWIGMSVSNVISGTLALVWIYRKRWLRPVIRE